MVFKKRFLLLPVILYILIYLFYTSFEEVKRRTIKDFNMQQMTLARQASNSIKTLFDRYFSELDFLCQLNHIALMDEDSFILIKNFYESNKSTLKGVTRVNNKGIITYTYPENKDALGADISYQNHIKYLMKHKKPVISDVFKTVQGFRAIAFHVPVFLKGEFMGSLSVLLPFEKLSESFISSIKTDAGGYAWMISKEGIELYCPIPGHVGDHVRNTCKGFPTLLDMTERMMNGESGTTVYHYNKYAGEPDMLYRKYAAYCPVKLYNTLWSIVVATPEESVLAGLKSIRNKWILSGSLLIIILSIYFIYSVKAYTMLNEENKRKQISDKLKESETNFQMVVDNSPLPVVITDEHFNIIHINKIYTTLFGFTLDEIPDINEWALKMFPDPEVRKDIVISWNNHLKEYGHFDTPYKATELKMHCKDGSVRIIDAVYYSIKNKGVAIFSDISDKIRAFEEKKILEEQLSRSKKMEALGLLAGGVAHDLNNILSGVVTYPELILMNLPQDSPIRNSVEIIKNSGEKAAAVVADLLTLARGVASQKTPLNINSVIKDYLNSAEFKRIEQDFPQVKLTSTLQDSVDNIIASQIHIRKTVMNLITNAFEAVRENGHVIIETHSLKVETPLKKFETIQPGSYTVLLVKDNGKGIPESNLERIFEPFYTKKVMGKSGSGLGLAVVWNTVKDHQGFIHIESSIDKGTTFELYFPSTEKQINKEDIQISLEELSGKQETVLIVDDESIQRDIVTELLTHLNYTVGTASSGEEAVKIVKRKDFDIILLDMIMGPGMNGQETFSEIRQFKPEQKAIIVSGLSHSEDINKTLEKGALAFVSKPYSIENLGKALKESLTGVK